MRSPRSTSPKPAVPRAFWTLVFVNAGIVAVFPVLLILVPEIRVRAPLLYSIAGTLVLFSVSCAVLMLRILHAAVRAAAHGPANARPRPSKSA